MAAVIGIVRRHDGGIRVQSAAGRGTTFTVLLPAIRGDARIPPVQPETAAPAIAGNGTILVVDDEAPVRAVASEMLKRLGFEVVTACNGREAIEICGREPPCFRAILLDLTMPELDGAEVVEVLRKVGRDIPVVLMSGYGEQDALGRFGSDAIAGFLQKPFRPEELKERLGQALARSHGQGGLA